MYVTPQTKLKVYRNIPWNNDYKHTLWFANATAQATFFASKVAYSFVNFTYVRQTGVIRVPMLADNLYNCNYISFQNESYGNKVFYAFITKVEYVNNETSHIYFEIDHIQSWLFDFTLEQCFVEREHVSDDTVGLHTVDEGLEVGEYLIDKQETLTHDNYGLMFISADNYQPQTPADVRYSGNLPQLVDIVGVKSSSIASFIGDILQYYFSRPEAVGSLKVIPDEMCESVYGKVQTFTDSKTIRRDSNITFRNACGEDTYTPKNNKLKCFPYCVITLDNFCGDVMQFRWEEFPDPTFATFLEKGTPAPIPVIECYPAKYKKNYLDFSASTKQFVMKFNNFPELAFPSDTFKMWATSQFKKSLVSEGASVVTRVVGGGLAGGAAGGVGGAIAGAGTGLLQSVASIYGLKTDYEYHKLHGYSLTGEAGDAGTNYNDHEVGFRLTSYQIKAEYAKLIDNYLTRFGYKVNSLKQPNVTSRRYFNYLKTVDASIRGNVPNEAQKLICNAFDNGITLWHTDDIGNYNVNNAIVG